MTRRHLASSGFVAAGLCGPLLLAGCSHTEGSPGAGMMGSPQSYHLAGLRCSAPASLPGTTIVVQLADMGMTQMMTDDAPVGARMMLHAGPSVVSVGRVSLVAQNVGWRTHEVVVLPLPDGSGDGQRVPGSDGKVSEADSLGEVSGSCAAGSGEGIQPGAVGWTTLTLSRGRYELICNLKNHYGNGMHQALTVQ